MKKLKIGVVAKTRQVAESFLKERVLIKPDLYEFYFYANEIGFRGVDLDVLLLADDSVDVFEKCKCYIR